MREELRPVNQKLDVLVGALAPPSGADSKEEALKKLQTQEDLIRIQKRNLKQGHSVADVLDENVPDLIDKPPLMDREQEHSKALKKAENKLRGLKRKLEAAEAAPEPTGKRQKPKHKRVEDARAKVVAQEAEVRRLQGRSSEEEGDWRAIRGTIVEQCCPAAEEAVKADYLGEKWLSCDEAKAFIKHVGLDGHVAVMRSRGNGTDLGIDDELPVKKALWEAEELKFVMYLERHHWTAHFNASWVAKVPALAEFLKQFRTDPCLQAASFRGMMEGCVSPRVNASNHCLPDSLRLMILGFSRAGFALDYRLPSVSAATAAPAAPSGSGASPEDAERGGMIDEQDGHAVVEEGLAIVGTVLQIPSSTSPAVGSTPRGTAAASPSTRAS